MEKSLNNRNRSLLRSSGAKVLAPALALLCLVAHCPAQGTLQVAFGSLPPGTYTTGSDYSESGMRFWTPYGPEGVSRVGSGVSWAPDNGSTYLAYTGGERLRFGFTPGRAFNLMSFDLAEDWPLPISVQVVGYKDMAVTVTTSFTTDGISDGPGGQQDFQSFSFDSQFVNVYQIDIITSHWALDNVMIGGVPEPSSGGFILLGAFCWFGWSRVRRMRL